MNAARSSEDAVVFLDTSNTADRNSELLNTEITKWQSPI